MSSRTSSRVGKPPAKAGIYERPWHADWQRHAPKAIAVLVVLVVTILLVMFA